MIDWTQVIVAFIGIGGLTAIVTLVERKSAAMLDNAKKLADSYKELAEEYQKREERTQQLLEDKEASLMSQIKMNSSLRHDLDDAHTETAVAKLMYCKNSKCVNRDPPFGCKAEDIMRNLRSEKPGKRYEMQTAPKVAEK
jgi:hypothetical protein